MTSASTVSLVAPEATKITVAGNHGVNLLGSNLATLTELDASGVVATGNYAVGLTAQQIAAAKEAAGAVWFASQVTDKSITVKTGNGANWVAAWSITDPTKSATISTGDGAEGYPIPGAIPGLQCHCAPSVGGLEPIIDYLGKVESEDA